ncbi:MAG: alpha/beta hydrolase [Acidobacteria bacterium]|nr:alpha/beta hydrolase [Acidobacteriota bacterium]
MTMGRLTIPGPHGPIGATVNGTGPPLVLLAGLGSTARVWGQLPELLGRSFTVICPDNRGVGGSRGGDPFTIAGAGREVTAVLDHLEIDRAALVGVSMGGSIALGTAIATPARVSGLVLVSCAARLSHHGRRMLDLLARLLDTLPAEEFGLWLMTLAFAPPFHERFPSFVIEAARLYGLDEEDVEGARLQVRHLLEGRDLRPELTTLALPCLVLSGARDTVVAHEDTAELAAIPGAQLEVFPDLGHSVLAEGGDRVLSRVTAFLRGLQHP